MTRIGAVTVAVLPVLVGCHALLPLGKRTDEDAASNGPDQQRPESGVPALDAPLFDGNVLPSQDSAATCGPKTIHSGGFAGWSVQSYGPGQINNTMSGEVEWTSTDSMGAVYEPLAFPPGCRLKIALTATFKTGEVMVRLYPHVCSTIQDCSKVGSYTLVFTAPQTGTITYSGAKVSQQGYKMVCVERVKTGGPATVSKLTLETMP